MQKISLQSAGRVSRNSSLLLIARLLDTFAQFIIISLISRYLGPKQYGDYGYVIAFGFLVGSFTYVGTERIATREIAKNPEKSASYLGASLIVRWLYMSFALLLMTISLLFLKLSPVIIISIYVASLSFNLNAETFIYLSVFRAFEKMQYETYLTFLFQFLNIAFVIIATHFKLGFLALFAGLLSANIARVIFAVFISYKNFVKPNLKVEFSLIKFILKESWVLALMALVMQVFINTDLVILRALKTSFDVSMFYAPHNLIIMMNIIPISLMSGLFPSLSKAAGKDSEGLFYRYEKTFKIFAVTSIFLATLFIVFTPKIIMILYGKEFLPAVHSFMLLGLALVFTTLFVVFDFILVAVKKQNTLILCPLIGIVVKIILDFLLISKYGYMGASAAALSGYIVFFISGLVLTSKYVGVLSLKRLIVKPVLIAVLIGLCLYRFNQINIFILGLLAFVVYALCLWATKFFLSDEIDLFRSIFQKFAGILAKKPANA